jgi:hypothetical protein
MNDRAMQSAFDNLISAASDRSWIVGRLGVANASGGYDIAVQGRSGYYYVSFGVNGELGQSIARDAVGVALVGFAKIRLKRENNDLVIRESEALAAGGSGPGSIGLDGLNDVTITSPVVGQTIQLASSGQWVNVTPPGGTGGAPVPHGLAVSAGYHSGLLPWGDLNKTGSSLADLASRQHSSLQGIGPNDHHNQAHVLATGTALGPDHTISGANVGEVLRALTATTAAFDVLQHTDLGNVLPDQHHAQVHNIVGSDHTIVGSQFQVVGATAVNTLGLLTATPTPGASAQLLRTDAAGGLQLDTNLLYVDAANNWIGANRTPNGATLDILAANNADHTQRIKQKSGQTGRLWRIEDTSGSELIVLDSVGNLQSGQPGFVSGLTGWRISPQGNAEFNNIWARGELHATVFVKDEVHATGGTLLVATAGVLHDDAAISSTLVDDDVLVVYSTPAGQGVPLQVVTTSGTFVGTQLHVSWVGNFINVNDPPSGPGFYFQPGDVIRSKTEVATGVTDFWLTVNSATQNSGYSTYSVVKQSGTDGTLPKGSAVVSYGQQGDGRILMTSDLNYAPYLDVFTVGPNVWSGAAGSIVPRVRLGRLDGVGLPGISGVPQYGLVAGSDLSDANSGYFIASDKQFALYKVPIRLNNGSADTGLWTADGNLRIGSNIGADATTGFRVYTTSGGGYNAGDVVIGNTSTGNFLRWNQVSGVLQVVGSLVVSDPGTTVTKTYVDAQDSSYDSLAQGYGTTAQTGAQTYSDARRIVGSNAAFTSASATTIAWATFSIMMASGGTRAIAAGSATLSTRTYLYVNLSLSGTLTLTTTTTISTLNGPNFILVAVADPAPGASGSNAATVTVVVGTTFISGGNIFTGSITAYSLAAHTVTANEIEVATINAINATAQSYATTAQGNAISAAAGDATSKANSAYSNATLYGDTHKLQAVKGSITVSAMPAGRNGITWSGVSLFYADGTVQAITNGSLTGMSTSARTYIYVYLGDTTFRTTLTLSELNPIANLVAVFDPGASSSDPGSLSIVGGATYISGNNIVTGSILASNIQAAAITADKMSVQRLDTMNLNAHMIYAGTVEVDATSNLHSSGKVYGGSASGFFLGWDSGQYKLDLGNRTNYLTWDGTNLGIQTNSAIILIGDNSDRVLSFVSTRAGSNACQVYIDRNNDNTLALTAPVVMDQWAQAVSLRLTDVSSGGSSRNMIQFTWAGNTHNLSYDGAILSYDGNMSANGSIQAVGPVIANANSIRITQSFTPGNSTTPAGTTGDIRWDSNFIYVWIGGSWRRATLNIF